MRVYSLLQAIALACVPQAVFGATIPTIPSGMSTCGLLTGLTCVSDGATGLSAYLAAVVIPGMQAIFLALAGAFFFYYAIRLILESNDENTVTETKSAYGYAAGGAAVVTLSSLLAQAFGIEARSTLVNPGPVITGLTGVIEYFRLMVSAVLSATILYQGIRLVMSQGDDSALEEQKKKFFYALIGVAVVLLANVGVSAFFPGDGAQIINEETVGIINFLLTILGTLAILAVIASGVFLVISTDEGLKDRAKRSTFTAIVAMIVILTSYTILNFIASL